MVHKEKCWDPFVVCHPPHLAQPWAAPFGSAYTGPHHALPKCTRGRGSSNRPAVTASKWTDAGACLSYFEHLALPEKPGAAPRVKQQTNAPVALSDSHLLRSHDGECRSEAFPCDGLDSREGHRLLSNLGNKWWITKCFHCWNYFWWTTLCYSQGTNRRLIPCLILLRVFYLPLMLVMVLLAQRIETSGFAAKEFFY